jgi:hypothetical protein
MPESEKKIIEVFEKWGQHLVEKSRRIIDAAIKADGGGQTSKLSGSGKYNVLNKNGVISFEFYFEGSPYWKFVDKGVDGTETKRGSPYAFKKKNIDQKAALAFVKTRHFKVELSTRTKEKAKGLKDKNERKSLKQASIDSQRKALAFIVGRGIAKHGIKPAHFMDKIVTKQEIEGLKKMLIPVLRDQFVLQIKNELK